jgi:hypothetical protein
MNVKSMGAITQKTNSKTTFSMAKTTSPSIISCGNWSSIKWSVYLISKVDEWITIILSFIILCFAKSIELPLAFWQYNVTIKNAK